MSQLHVDVLYAALDMIECGKYYYVCNAVDRVRDESQFDHTMRACIDITNWIHKACGGVTFDYFVKENQMVYTKSNGVSRKIKWIKWMINNHEMFDNGYHPDQVQDMLASL